MSLTRGLILFIGFVLAARAQGPPGPAALETRADAQFSARDCVSAAATYLEAVSAAIAAGQSGRLPLYYRRIGICRARLGDLEGALSAYNSGVEAGNGQNDIEMLAENLHGAALALLKLGRIDEGLPLAQREYELTQKCGHPAHVVRAMWMLSDFDNVAGRMSASISKLEAAIRISRAARDKAATSMLLDNLATRYFALGDVASATAMEEEVISLTDPANTASLAITLANLGAMQQHAGDIPAALQTMAAALAAATAPESRRIRVAILTNLAKLHSDRGDRVAGEAESAQALSLAHELKIPDIESEVQHFRADLFLGTGTKSPGRDLTRAATAAAAALELGTRAGSSQRIYEALFARAAVREAEGDLAGATGDFEAAIRTSELLRAEIPGDASDLRAAFENLVPLYRAAAANLLLRHLPVEALMRTEQAKARVLMDMLLRGGVDERAAMTPGETAERRRLRRNLASARGSANADRAASELRAFERTLYGAHPELALQSANFEAAGPAGLAKLLTGGQTALLDYFFIPSGVALFVVRSSGVTAFVVPDPDNTLPVEIHQFREKLAARDLDYKPFARRLFDRLVAPAMGALGGTTEWVISPDGALWETPFVALVDPSGRHLIETRSVTLVPSLTAAIQLRRRNQTMPKATLPLLAVGNPLPSSLPLPDAADEAIRIGAGVPGGGAVVITGAAATRAAFLARAADARIIHLAAHAGLNDRDPLSSSIAFGAPASGQDSLLTARDIMDLHLRADLVVLSGCDTALGASRPGEGMIGMGWALSMAGASSSILSYWKVDSASSRDFMVALHRHLPGAPKAAALRQTALEMMQAPGHRHPFYWAPFTLWGS